MSILFCDNIDAEVAGTLILQDVSFRVEKGEKVGLIGENGAGKTTLLKAIVGEQPLVKGNIYRPLTIGYLSQTPADKYASGTVFDIMLSEKKEILEMRDAISCLETRMSETIDEKILEQYGNLIEKYERSGGYALEAQIRRILTGLGLGEDYTKNVSLLSGGQKTRLALCKLLLTQPDLLVLDEPTNHLDIDALEWLEKFLQNYPGSLLVVSHDRYFLDRVVNKILFIQEGKVKQYTGNYSAYELQRALEEKSLLREAQKINTKIALLEEYIRKHGAGIKAKQAKGREKQLQKIKPVPVPKTSKNLNLDFGTVNRSGSLVLEVRDLSVAYGKKVVFKNINLSIRRGERIALLGRNGVGKTSLLKAITGKIPYNGIIDLGANVSVGYYSQEHEDIGLKDTVIDEIRYSSKLDDQQIRNVLARYGFRGDDVFKNLKTLSGGEKSRLALCKLFLTHGNLLLLDEPTNHLDIRTRDMLEEALQDYEGTILVVSHDRYFLDRIVNKVAVLTASGLEMFEGDYTAYLEYKEQKNDAIQLKDNKNGDEAFAKVYQEKSKINKRKERKLKNLEQEIAKAETALRELEIELGSIHGNYERVLILNDKYNDLKIKYDGLLMEWLELAE
mgnify:CR=1 FL=1